MIILSVETSCDETAISLIEASGGLDNPSFFCIANCLISQMNIHKEFGGVYPNIAKREHNKNLTMVLKDVFNKSIGKIDFKNFNLDKDNNIIKEILKREDGLYEDLMGFLSKIDKVPQIDLITVTKGPGLIPALWVGVSFAKALSKIWDIPLLGVNHMEGHIASVLFCKDKTEAVESEKLNIKSKNQNTINFPALALLISGGHTELVLISNWGQYKILGQTVDDAVGEAFDKVARMLDLPYPGGPEVSKLAKYYKDNFSNEERKINLPRPMLKSADLNFSFSGLKTAVLYTIRDLGEIDERIRSEICYEFELAVTEVLLYKTKKAIEEFNINTLIIGGGVISNNFIRDSFKEMIEKDFSNIELKIADKSLATDNAIMIAMSGYIGYLLNPEKVNEDIIANGNLKY